MKKLLLLTTALLALSAPAFATVFGDEGGNSIVNNSGVANNGTINGSTINNGAGSGSTNLSNTNHNTNSSVNVNSSSSRSDASSRSTSSAKQSQGQFQAQSQNARSSVKDSGNSENTNSVYVAAQKRNPVSTAYAAPLVAADDTCMGSSSAGAQGVGFGLSLGSTWQDGDCVRRKDARELHNMGYRGASIALMCQNADVAKAMNAAGTPCPQQAATLAPASGATWGDEEPVRISHAPGNGSRKN